MYNLVKSILFSTYISTFHFYIDDRALTIKFLFKNLNPVQWISLEFNTSSFLLSYVDSLIGCWKKELGPKQKKFLSADILFHLGSKWKINTTWLHLLQHLSRADNEYHFDTHQWYPSRKRILWISVVQQVKKDEILLF